MPRRQSENSIPRFTKEDADEMSTEMKTRSSQGPPRTGLPTTTEVVAYGVSVLVAIALAVPFSPLLRALSICASVAPSIS